MAILRWREMTVKNILVAEPSGRYGDGWMIRVDDGILRVHLCDSQAHGVEWQIFEGQIDCIRYDGILQ